MMKSLLRFGLRFLVLCALGLWLGGFSFYTAFVISAGRRHVSSGRFGFVTGEVTAVVNLLGVVVALGLLASVVVEWRQAGRMLRWGLAGTWILYAATLALVMALHARLDAQMDYRAHEVLGRDTFDVLHERYELAATVQWAAGLLHLGCLLARWSGKEPPATAGTGTG
jgi:hypothetical protein